ncbi:glycosyltransferase [Legionella saoudiensis]|uniref:glycosyltransferase n=1 Tax=Legionella saoudiensis TaxID=1750561 RepID=UPI0007304BE7|nr:glycosyltransferase [Legionella saoudiensis]
MSSILYFFIYLGVLVVGYLYIPKDIAIYYENREAFIYFGFIGVWRYAWWLNHIIRSTIYSWLVFPHRRKQALQLWNSGWRPKRLFFMMTTFKELPSTTEAVLQSIIDECTGLTESVKLFIGIGDDSDKHIIQNFFSQQKTDFTLEIFLVKQKLPGKRYAIGEALRAMVNHGLTPDDYVVFMDGDTYFKAGCLKQCLPFFPLFPKMQALTTHEQALVYNGPNWIKKWLDVRFSQRHFTMQSYALSNKVLTLTGRMSIFRGKHLCEKGFLDIIEQDHLKHWLWGYYRFLSGDDKSTWYYLLKHQAEMFYIPDALTVTIESIHGSALDRMKENLRRWSGNTLRNGARAIALGPRKVGYFIWWCLIDQRCAIWTMLIGHLMIIALAIHTQISFLIVALLWIAFSRLCLAVILFLYAKRIDMSFPFLIYINQLLSTLIKIYILFRLPQQRWKNRGDQHAGFKSQKKWQIRNWVASYLTLFYCLLCILLILFLLQLVSLPTIGDIKTLW